MKSPIVVMGVSGSGKSTVGAALAQRLEPLEADEHGVVVDVDQDIDAIVENYLIRVAGQENR